MITKNLGMLALAIYLILVGIISLFHVGIPLIVIGILALIAGILGFGGIAGASIEIAKAIFFIAIILFLVSAVVGLARGRTRV